MSGALKWSPETFWASTYPELLFSYIGLMKSLGAEMTENYATREDLNKMIEKYG